jgi:hypothetical protein
MKMFNLGAIKNSGLRNVAKMWNEVYTWYVVDWPEAWERIKRDKDSHSIVEMRVRFHEKYHYTSAHWALFRDAFDIALLTFAVYVVV